MPTLSSLLGPSAAASASLAIAPQPDTSSAQSRLHTLCRRPSRLRATADALGYEPITTSGLQLRLAHTVLQPPANRWCFSAHCWHLAGPQDIRSQLRYSSCRSGSPNGTTEVGLYCAVSPNPWLLVARVAEDKVEPTHIASLHSSAQKQRSTARAVICKYRTFAHFVAWPKLPLWLLIYMSLFVATTTQHHDP